MNKVSLILIVLLSGCVTQEAKQTSQSDAIGKDSPEYYLESGYSYLDRNTKRAIQDFDAAIELCKKQHGNSGEAVYASRGLAETLFYMAKAASDEKDAIAVRSTCADALYLKAFASLDLGEVEVSQALLEQALSMSPVNSMYLSELGHVYHIKSDWEKALEIFTAAESAARMAAEKINHR